MSWVTTLLYVAVGVFFLKMLGEWATENPEKMDKIIGYFKRDKKK